MLCTRHVAQTPTDYSGLLFVIFGNSPTPTAHTHFCGEICKKSYRFPKQIGENRFRNSKTRDSSCITEAKAEYDEQKAACDVGNTDGSPYHPDSLTKKWLRFVAKNNLTHIRLYDLRYTNATSMIGAGVPTKVVSERLGHADINTTLKYYVHTTPEMNEGAAEKIDDIIFH